ncbi:MAG TPA: BON domain-containing protein [Acidobacteriaceae bacterium]|nr:BON domain-containing protein [Acidobacteriaceae bacterium]
MDTNGLRGKWTLRAGAMVALAGCLWIPAAMAQSATANDGDLQSKVAAALTNDTALEGQHVKAFTSNGVVTLTGNVQTQQQRQEAETVAANVSGVAGIQDNIVVADSSQALPPPPPQGQEPAEPPMDNQQATADNQQAAPQAQNGQLPPPPPPDQQQTPARPAYQGQSPYGQAPGAYNAYIPQGQQGPPPQAVSGPVTVPAGTLLQIRTSEPLDTGKLQDGAAFQATVASDVFEGNVLAIPRGAVLQGTVVKVKKPGALGGAGELELQLTTLNLGGNAYPLTSDIWSSKGPNKAGYTAANTVGGALVGALIGGAIGRGPGAAVGALAGGGAGMLASAGTNGPRQILLPETLLNFHLSSAVTVQPVSWQEAQRLAQSAPQLQRRPVYYARPYPYAYPYPPYPYPY